VDFYSDYVSHLKNTTAATVIKFMKIQFSRRGIPDVLVSDNGPQFVSKELAEFPKDWEFQHVTSSPYYQNSNGKAEYQPSRLSKVFFSRKQLQMRRIPG
jgi:transposase InsO family protein